ncbi:hypothetical protein MY8738_008727 [Beauveria namnaoensis]
MAAPYRLREQLPPPKHPDDGLPMSETTSLSDHRDGFLSESNAPDATPLALAADDLLLGRDYYFHVLARNGDAGRYPTVPSFENFAFPHNDLPLTWNAPELKLQSRPRDTIHTRDKSCRITASVLGNEVAHLIPRKEDAWFTANQITMYAVRTEAFPSNATNDTSNALLLCSNLHQAFDNRQLADDVIRAGVARRLVPVGEDGRSHASDVSGKECRDGFLPALARGKSRSQSRSHSPKKRTRDDLVQDEWGDLSDSTDGDIGDSDWVSVSSSAASSFGSWRDALKDDDIREAPSEDKNRPPKMAISTVKTTPAIINSDDNEDSEGDGKAYLTL